MRAHFHGRLCRLRGRGGRRGLDRSQSMRADTHNLRWSLIHIRLQRREPPGAVIVCHELGRIHAWPVIGIKWRHGKLVAAIASAIETRLAPFIPRPAAAAAPAITICAGIDHAVLHAAPRVACLSLHPLWTTRPDNHHQQGRHRHPGRAHGFFTSVSGRPAPVRQDRLGQSSADTSAGTGTEIRPAATRSAEITDFVQMAPGGVRRICFGEL